MVHRRSNSRNIDSEEAEGLGLIKTNDWRQASLRQTDRNQEAEAQDDARSELRDTPISKARGGLNGRRSHAAIPRTQSDV